MLLVFGGGATVFILALLIGLLVLGGRDDE